MRSWPPNDRIRAARYPPPAGDERATAADDGRCAPLKALDSPTAGYRGQHRIGRGLNHGRRS